MLDQLKVPNTIKSNSTQSGWILSNHVATIQFGESLANALVNTEILLLSGPLGAGKTSLVKGIAKGLSITEPITSPTFALSHHYLNGKRPLIHLDLYRLEEISANELFLQEEELSKEIQGLMVIEWPSQLSIQLPDACNLTLKYLSNGGREIALHNFIGPMSRIAPPQNN